MFAFSESECDLFDRLELPFGGGVRHTIAGFPAFDHVTAGALLVDHVDFKAGQCT